MKFQKGDTVGTIGIEIDGFVLGNHKHDFNLKEKEIVITSPIYTVVSWSNTQKERKGKIIKGNFIETFLYRKSLLLIEKKHKNI